MTLVVQWLRIAEALPDNWADARLRLALADEARADRAAALLGPAAPGRHGRELRFVCARRGAGVSPDALRRLLARLDDERIDGELELITTGEATTPEPRRALSPPLAESWLAAVAGLPADWSDLYVEIELFSTDHLDRGALLLAPVNPARWDGAPAAFRFRCARSFGYGASPEMVRRCLERLDESGIRGTVRILRALSDSNPVATQGPVWYVGGKAV